MSERVNDPRLQLLERTPEGDLQLQQGAELLDAEGSSMVRVKTKFVTAADFQTEPAAATFGTQVVDVGGTRVGGSATGLTNTVAATSGKQTVQASALSLNHFDGSDEDQSTADGIAGNVVALNTCRLDTAQKKFGTTSLRVPINGLTTILLGSGLHGGATAEVMLDFWIRHGDVDDRIDFKFRDSAQPGLTFPAISFGLKSHGASAKLYYGVSTDGSAQEDAVTGATTGVGMNKNVWHFVRLVHRANAKTEIWLNESLIHVVTPAAIPYPWDQVIIDGDNLVFAQAWVDDMRVHPRHGFYEVGVVTASPTAAFDPANTELWNGVDAPGTQVVDVGGTRVGGDPTGLVNDTTIYEATVTVDGVPNVMAFIGSDAQTYTTLLGKLNDETAGATWSLSGGNLLCTSDTPSGTGSTIEIVDDDLFVTLTTFVAINAAVAGTASVTYTATVTIDGGAPQALDVVGNEAQTYTTLLAELNADTVGATWSASGSNLLLTSDTTGATSAVLVEDGDLFSALPAFVAIATAIPGADAVDVTYQCSILFNPNAQNKTVTFLGSVAQTYTDLIAAIEADIGASGTIALVGGNLQVTSDEAPPGLGNTVDITDGGGGNSPLFASLADYVAINSPVDGVDVINGDNIELFTLPDNAVYLRSYINVHTAFNPGTSLFANLRQEDSAYFMELVNLAAEGVSPDDQTSGEDELGVRADLYAGVEFGSAFFLECTLDGALPTVGLLEVGIMYFIGPALP